MIRAKKLKISKEIGTIFGTLSISAMETIFLKKTLVEMKNHDHNDAIVVIATLTNNIRYNQSLTTIRGLQEQIIKELKRETDQNNIVFLACPPTRSPANFDTHMSNCYTCLRA